MIGQYPKEYSIVFIMNLTSAPFQLSHPFPSPLLPYIAALSALKCCAAVE